MSKALVLLGAPGAGKGTQAKLIAQKLAIPAISTGEIFRSNIAGRTALGVQAQAFIERGEYVPDSVTNPMVEARLGAPDTAGGFLLDGYPRTLAQAQTLRSMLDASGREVGLVLEIVVPEEILVSRLLTRAQFEHRADDSEPVIRHRMEVYHATTEPMATYYADQDLLIDIDGSDQVEQVWARIEAALDKHWPG